MYTIPPLSAFKIKVEVKRGKNAGYSVHLSALMATKVI
jgi:hypothetical protein